MTSGRRMLASLRQYKRRRLSPPYDPPPPTVSFGGGPDGSGDVGAASCRFCGTRLIYGVAPHPRRFLVALICSETRGARCPYAGLMATRHGTDC